MRHDGDFGHVTSAGILPTASWLWRAKLVHTHVGVDVVLVDAVPAADVWFVGGVLGPLLARGTDVFKTRHTHTHTRCWGRSRGWLEGRMHSVRIDVLGII